MDWNAHFQKDIAYHAATAHEYDAVVVDPRVCLNDFLFRDFHARIRPGNRMLDLGCGTGHAVAAFGGAFRSVLGVDHSREMLTRARENLSARNIHHATLIEQDLFSFLGSVAGRFDLVTSVGCFHHLPSESISIVINDIYSILNNKGQFLLADPIEVDLTTQPREIMEWNRDSVAAGLEFSTDADEADEAPLNLDHLLAALFGAGFEIELQRRAWELFPHHLPATGPDRETIGALHERYGAGGNVVCILCRKSAD